MRGEVHPMRPKVSDLSRPCADGHRAAGEPNLVRRHVTASYASTSRAARNLSTTSRPRKLSDTQLARPHRRGRRRVQRAPTRGA